MSSFYNRVDQGDITVFTVVPAPYPGAAQGNLLFFGGLAMAVLTAPLILLVVGLFLVPVALFCAFAGWRLRSNFKRENAERLQQDVRVSGAGIAAGNREFRARDIAEFVVTHSMAGPDRVHYERIDSGAKALGATLRENTQNAQHYVCYQTSIRLLSDSRPIVLVGGLTSQTAEGLSRDLAATLADARAKQAA